MTNSKIKLVNFILIFSILVIIECQRPRQQRPRSTSTTSTTTPRPAVRRTTTQRTTTTARPRTTTLRTTRRPTTTSTAAPRTTTTHRPVTTTHRTTPRPRPTTPKPKKRKPNRNRNRGKQEPDPRLQCYTCYADFERIPFSVQNPAQHIYNNNCYNPSLNYTYADSEYLTRRCGSATCRKTCLARGYGVIRETCTFCCSGRHTEDDPEYDEDEHAHYKCPMEPH